MINLLFFEEGDDEMYRDVCPHLPKTVLLNSPPGLKDFLNKLEQLEILGIEVQVATADILELIRVKETALYNLAVSSHEMLDDIQLSSELGNDVGVYVTAREAYGIGLYKELNSHGLYVGGVLYYQLSHVDQYVLVLEKMQIPFINNEQHDRFLAMRIDTACRRAISTFDARTAR
jgi:hypothetical protein